MLLNAVLETLEISFVLFPISIVCKHLPTLGTVCLWWHHVLYYRYITLNNTLQPTFSLKWHSVTCQNGVSSCRSSVSFNSVAVSLVIKSCCTQSLDMSLSLFYSPLDLWWRQCRLSSILFESHKQFSYSWRMRTTQFFTLVKIWILFKQRPK